MGLGPGSGSLHGRAFPAALSFCPSVGSVSFVRFCVVHSRGACVHVCICHTKSGVKLQPGASLAGTAPPFFSRWPEGPPAISTAGDPGCHLSCAGPEVPSPTPPPLDGGDCTQENEVQGGVQCSILRFRGPGLAPSHPALSSGEEGRGLESTEPFPRLCRLRTAFSFAHVLVCRGDRVLVGTQTRGLQACSHSSRRGLQPREAFPTLEAPLPLFLCPQPGFSLSMVCLLH